MWKRDRHYLKEYEYSKILIFPKLNRSLKGPALQEESDLSQNGKILKNQVSEKLNFISENSQNQNGKTYRKDQVFF
ncbi:hypothetical protein CH380_03325 [Leptospira adleri]|uniref:Uncharacterized protein n=1 Tax=Leptospira adleri TaxID=2023186 RepID=A0A2M9YTB4_9LEPT|nr:hypothetical protein CH380_03325 [Leptospira adleri]PJZ60473.1 hypothetical protein CH376_18390 [Leptospira adleri]